MTAAFDPKLLEALSEVVSDRSGLRFGPDRREDLERGVRAAARELGFSDPLKCASSLVSSSLTAAQLRILASHLTIGETYFFREKASFQLLEERILPQLIEMRRGGTQRIRIWSAGCCTGEEPYSVAICLARLLPDPTGWDIVILGTDINDRFLQKAREAVYSEWSFRETPPSIVERYFTRTQSGRRLLPHLRQHCTFANLNMAEDIYPSFRNGTDAIDVILCRNVLIYFDPEHASRLVRNLGQALTDNGWLLVGAAEGSQVQCEDLAPVEAPGTMAFRKRTATERVSVELPTTTVAAQADDDSFSTTTLPPEPLATPDPATSPVTLEELAETPLAMAIASHEQGLYADVIAGLLPVCTAGDGDSLSLEFLARAYANQGNHAQALEWCEKAIAVDKVNPRLHYLRAAILQELGEAAEATASFRRVIYLDDQFVMAHVGAAHLALRFGKRKEANRHLARAHQLLSKFGPDQTVPESEGLDAEHLAELVEAAWKKRNPR